jgi:Protein of unknown function (DUF3435)
MNHQDAHIYQAYINENVGCDTQSAFLGRPSQRAIIDEFSTMGYRRDRRAPTELTDAERESLKNHPSILELRGKLKDIKERLKDSDSGMDEEDREALYEQKVELNMKIHRTKVALHRDAKRIKRRNYFDTVDVDEIERQLACGGDEDEGGGQGGVDQKPERLTHQLPERKELVRLFFDKNTGMLANILLIKILPTHSQR